MAYCPICTDCFDDDVDTDGLDLRTRAGREEEVVRKVRRDGGFSVWWSMESAGRECAVDRLFDSGRLRGTGGEFPNVKCEVVEDAP